MNLRQAYEDGEGGSVVFWWVGERHSPHSNVPRTPLYARPPPATGILLDELPHHRSLSPEVAVSRLLDSGVICRAGVATFEAARDAHTWARRCDTHQMSHGFLIGEVWGF